MKKKKRINFKKVLVVLIGILIFGVIGYKVAVDFIFNGSNTDEIKEVENIKLYGYSMDSNDTKYFNSTFKELAGILKQETVDYEAYAGVLTKLFIIDFYTLSNKQSSVDIGGLQYIYPDLEENFVLNASDTIYKYIKLNLDGTREQELPTISEVTIESNVPTTYKIDDITYNGYLVSASWKYETDLGYETSGKFIIIKDNMKLYIVEGD